MQKIVAKRIETYMVIYSSQALSPFLKTFNFLIVKWIKELLDVVHILLQNVNMQNFANRVQIFQNYFSQLPKKAFFRQ